MSAQKGKVEPQTAIPFLRKISPKTVCEAVGFMLADQQRPVPKRHLYDLFGVIRSSRTVEDRTGMNRKPTIRFGGKFRAVTQEGHEFDSGVTFIPVLDEMIEATLKEAQAANEEAQIEIALSVSIVPAPTGKASATGYEFDVQRILQGPPAVHDPIERMRAEAAAARAALPAPSRVSDSTTVVVNGSGSVDPIVGDPNADSKNAGRNRASR